MKRFLSLLFLSLSFLLASSFVPNSGDKKYGIKTVVIDAGHGGHDSGCLGNYSKEKDVALSIALKLGKYIENNFNDVKVIYTRKTDVFVELNQRAAVANKNKADVFICIHCNDGPKTAYGTETWVMGLHKTEDNLNVAKRENASILMEYNYKSKYDGYDINSPESNIIFSLYQSAFIEQSLNLASKVQKYFKGQAMRSSRGVKQAGLLVLYKTAMPSVLIETGFLTNPAEEKYMSSEKGQDMLASSIFSAFKEYKAEIEGSTTTGDKTLLQSEKTPVVSNKSTQSSKTSQKRVSSETAKPSIDPSIKEVETPISGVVNTDQDTTKVNALKKPALLAEETAEKKNDSTKVKKDKKKEKKIDPEALQRAADKAEFERFKKNQQSEKATAEGDKKVASEAKERLNIELSVEEKERKERLKKEAEEKARKEYEAQKKKEAAEREAKVKAEVERIKKIEAEKLLKEAKSDEDFEVVSKKVNPEQLQKVKEKEVSRQKAIESHEARVLAEMEKMRKRVNDSLAAAEEKDRQRLEDEAIFKLTGKRPKRDIPVQQAQVVDSTKIKKKKKKLDAEALERLEDRKIFNLEKNRKTEYTKRQSEVEAKSKKDIEEYSQIREEAVKRLEEEAAKEKAAHPQPKKPKEQPVVKAKQKKHKVFDEGDEPEPEEIVKPVTKYIAGVPVIDKSGVFMAIQIATSDRPVPRDSIGTDAFVEKNIDGTYKYLVGKTTSYSDAVLTQRTFRKAGFPDAFMIAYNEGKRVGVQEARNVLAANQRALAYQESTIVRDTFVSKPMMSSATDKKKAAELERLYPSSKQTIQKELQEMGLAGKRQQPEFTGSTKQDEIRDGYNADHFAKQFAQPKVVEGIVYRVQIAVSDVPIPPTSDMFLNTKREIIRETTIDGTYRYMIGNFLEIKDANLLLKNLRLEGFRNAFIVAYNRNQRINLQDTRFKQKN